MMTTTAHSKIQARHLTRDAYLYIRQSSLRQVLENTESTARQYALKQRAIALGWRHEQVIVVDTDQGQSGASAVDRAGFQMLVTAVGMERAGIVMGLEVSRLARNSTDWHRLLEICALTDTLILDEDGIYDPGHYNDRLLLGLKGTMSEAELHLLRARLQGGLLNKARRGDLQCRVPIGFVYDAAGRVVLDPDQRVQHTIRTFFATFRRTGSATATAKHFRAQRWSFPRRLWHGPRKGDVIWGPLDHSRTLWVLHHPRYAGAFVYGRTRQRRHEKYHKLPREEWTALIRDAHPGYISWDHFEHHQTMLRENAAVQGRDRRRSPPREGPALLQGIVICGKCGIRMTVRYHHARDTVVPIYVCQREGIETGPEHLTTRRLDAVVRRKATWIVQRLRRVQSHGPPWSPREFVSGESVLYLGRHYRLKVNPRGTGDAKLRGGWLHVPVPAGARQTAHVRAEVIAWLRRHAAARLPERVVAWRAKAGVPMPRVVIANQEKRWGSCDQHGTIRLNWRIIQAPMRLVDYVVVHELVHLRHRGHGRDYWQAVGRVMPDYERRREDLKQRGVSLAW